MEEGGDVESGDEEGDDEPDDEELDVGTAAFEEGFVDFDPELEGLVSVAIGIRLVPNVAVVVLVATLPLSTSSHVN